MVNSQDNQGATASGWQPRIIFFDTIDRENMAGGVALVTIHRCDWTGEDDRKYTKVAEYETLSRGAKASAKREIARLKKEVGA